MVLNYFPVPKFTPYILVILEAIPPLHLCDHSFFQVVISSFVHHPCYTPMNCCHRFSSEVDVETHHYCNQTPVRLAMHTHRRQTIANIIP